jgi:hypothetical protein
MTNLQRPARSAIGGAANEAGTEYRRGVAAYFAAHGLNGIPLAGFPVEGDGATVEAVALETDLGVDDLLVSLRCARLLVQAKRTLSWKLMPDIARQWVTALRDSQFHLGTDFLVAVTGSPSGPVRALAQALRRTRDGATSYTDEEAGALKRLRGLLAGCGASVSECETIIEHTVILQLTVEDPDHDDATLGRLLLDGHVATKGEGGRTWRELLSIAGDAARFRVGYSVEQWLLKLRQRGIPLVTDTRASHAAYLAARMQAVAQYRDTLTRRGAMVDLSPLGIAVPPIPLEDMDAGVSLRRPGMDRDEFDPFWTFRRHGRVVVTGLPGGGKSTTVASIAGNWASYSDWSLPILASLRRLGDSRRFRDRALRDRIIEMAVEGLDPHDQPLVADALHEALRDGTAVLILDGLDEAADRSLLLVADISDLLQGVHPETDVLIATRDTAYADTQQLQFSDFRLGPPRDVSSAVSAVLEAIAKVRNVDDPRGWIAARREWVKKALDADSALRETPIFAVLLASLAADAATDELPRTRALILERVVQEVVKRREARRGPSLPGIDESHHAAVLLGLFPLIAHELMNAGGAIPRAELAGRLAPYLVQEWGLAPAAARANAETALLFWDEAGVFVASGADKVVAPRLQLLMEIGVALHAATLTAGEAAAWVQDTAKRPGAREALALAAGKSPGIADALVDTACELADFDLLTVTAPAVSHDGLASEAALRKLAGRLREHVSSGGRDGWRAFRLVSDLKVPVELQEPILQAVDAHYPQPYPAIARGYACLTWGWQPDRLDEYLESVLLSEKPSLSPPASGFDLSSATDAMEMRLLEIAAETLLPRRADLAPAAARAMERASMRTAEVIATALRRCGHGDLAGRDRPRLLAMHQQLLAGARDTVKQIDGLLEMVRSLAPAAQLSLAQQRRLPEFASFIQTLDLNSLDAWPRTPDAAATWREFVEAVVTLGGFDRSILAAQSEILQDERASDPSGTNQAFWSLIDLQVDAALVHWDGLSEPSVTRDLMLEVVRGGGEAARVVASKALIHNPDRAGSATALKRIVDGGPPASVLVAVWAYLNLVQDADVAAEEMARSSRDRVREAVARLVPPVEEGQITSRASKLARDPIRQVRLGVLEHFQRSEKNLAAARPLLKEVAEGTDPDFTCYHCGTQNPASSESCKSCHIVTERPSKIAGRLIKALDSLEDAEEAGAGV